MTVRGFCALIGLLVLLLMFASSGLAQGDLCIGDLGCIRSDQSGVLIHGKDTP